MNHRASFLGFPFLLVQYIWQRSKIWCAILNIHIVFWSTTVHIFNCTDILNCIVMRNYTYSRKHIFVMRNSFFKFLNSLSILNGIFIYFPLFKKLNQFCSLLISCLKVFLLKSLITYFLLVKRQIV